jgi:alpha-tubulin suppressor-like RCC1 family protein
VYCWGADLTGELGVKSTSPDCPSIGGRCSARPLRVALPGRAIAVAAGDWHSCAIVAGGAAYCWGANYYGQLGAGLDAFSYDSPQPVAGGLAFASIAAGRFHTCGITTGGDTYCWGEDFWAQLGSGTVPADRCSYFFDNEPCSRTPLKVVGGHQFTSLTASDRATCALTAAGATYCWGMEVGGNDGTICQAGQRTDCTRTPIAAAAGFSFTSAGMSQVAKCAIDAAGTISCWGTDYYGMFGNGTQYTQAPTPVTAAEGAHWGSFVVGFSHVCALTTTGSAECWGASPNGEVGDGTSETERLVPTRVAAGDARFVALSSTGQSPFTCGLLATSRVLCWGSGTLGQLGNGALSSSSTPVEIVFPN